MQVAEQLLSPLGHAGNVPAEISRSLQSRYGELLAGTGSLRMPEAAGPTGCKNPEGQHLLAASIKELREAHVLYIHTANHDLKQVGGVQPFGAQLCRTCRVVQLHKQSVLGCHQGRACLFCHADVCNCILDSRRGGLLLLYVHTAWLHVKYLLHSLAALLVTVLMRLVQRLEEVHAEAGNSAAKARQQQVALRECQDRQQAIIRRLKAAQEVRDSLLIPVAASQRAANRQHCIEQRTPAWELPHGPASASQSLICIVDSGQVPPCISSMCSAASWREHAVCVGHAHHMLLTDCHLCVQLRSIMEDRLSELSALHWGLSGQLSKAEADLRDRQLPEMEEQAGAVKAHVTVSQRTTPYFSCQMTAALLAHGRPLSAVPVCSNLEGRQKELSGRQRRGVPACHPSNLQMGS